jgi:hypothetical protein
MSEAPFISLSTYIYKSKWEKGNKNHENLESILLDFPDCGSLHIDQSQYIIKHFHIGG